MNQHLMPQLLLPIFLSGCIFIQCDRKMSQTQKHPVVVSILPLVEFVEKVGAEKVDVTTMVPPGASPHTYEPSANQLVKVSQAAMYVKVGTPIEFELAWLDKILSLNQQMYLVDASDSIAALQHTAEENDESSSHAAQTDGAVDPHIWLSPANANRMIENICNGLVAIDSTNAAFYRANARAYQLALDSLDAEIRQLLTNKTHREFMVYHPSWSYFARDYDLVQVPVEKDGKAPTPRGLRFLVEQAKKHQIRIVFASPQFSTKSADVIAKEIEGEVVLISPLEKDYILNLRKIAKKLAQSME
ncbi:zinc ABC transporter substrate-binding protein [candidate division KSB1 bacterium]|nr:zinc ABC transporter substrate-binding protein [candidate division KSB1 bacterium]